MVASASSAADDEHGGSAGPAAARARVAHRRRGAAAGLVGRVRWSRTNSTSTPTPTDARSRSSRRTPRRRRRAPREQRRRRPAGRTSRRRCPSRDAHRRRAPAPRAGAERDQRIARRGADALADPVDEHPTPDRRTPPATSSSPSVTRPTGRSPTAATALCRRQRSADEAAGDAHERRRALVQPVDDAEPNGLAPSANTT